MADVNFSLDDYIARKAISVPRATASRGALGRGRPLAGRLGGRPTGPAPVAPPVRPLMKTPVVAQSYDARQKILEKVRRGDARDKIISKSRLKLKDARDRIGKQMPPHQEIEGAEGFPPNGRSFPDGGVSRPQHHYRSEAPPPMPRHAVPLMMANVDPQDDVSPRRRPDAQIFGRDNNIIVMAKNDFAGGRAYDDAAAGSMHRGNPVVVIKNDRMRGTGGGGVDSPLSSMQRQRPAPNAPTTYRTRSSPPRRGAPQQASRKTAPYDSTTARRHLPNEFAGARGRTPPMDAARINRRTPPKHYDSASDDELADPRRKPGFATKRAAPQARQVPRPEKQARRGSPEPVASRLSSVKSKPVVSHAPVAKKSSSILHGIKPVVGGQLAKESDVGDKHSPIQGYRVLVSNLHSIVTQEDVVELFSACGALKRTKMIKPSVAEVVFVKREDAEMAVKKYNNRELDGQPMQCKMLSPPSKSSSSSFSDGPMLGGRLKASSQAADDVEATTIHKALFNTSAAAPASKAAAKPVVFTVKI